MTSFNILVAPNTAFTVNMATEDIYGQFSARSSPNVTGTSVDFPPTDALINRNFARDDGDPTNPNPQYYTKTTAGSADGKVVTSPKLEGPQSLALTISNSALDIIQYESHPVAITVPTVGAPSVSVLARFLYQTALAKGLLQLGVKWYQGTTLLATYYLKNGTPVGGSVPQELVATYTSYALTNPIPTGCDNARLLVRLEASGAGNANTVNVGGCRLDPTPIANTSAAGVVKTPSGMLSDDSMLKIAEPTFDSNGDIVFDLAGRMVYSFEDA